MTKPGRTAPSPDRLHTIPYVADECRVSTKTVRGWIKSKELAAYKLGRQWRIADKDLKHFLRERWNG